MFVCQVEKGKKQKRIGVPALVGCEPSWTVWAMREEQALARCIGRRRTCPITGFFVEAHANRVFQLLCGFRSAEPNRERLMANKNTPRGQTGGKN